ncbi:MAG: hypothetical protein IPP40_07260 [bacterium]|nr:hypothetical protein [bacterium]
MRRQAGITEFDVTEPPLPPSGNFVRARVDGDSWDSPFGRFFVTDIRAPFADDQVTDSWDFIINASESGTVSMTFDLEALGQYDMPEGFHLTATVNGQTFDINEDHTITFNYSSEAQVIVHLVATLSSLQQVTIIPRFH